jgi:hypothetical protein
MSDKKKPDDYEVGYANLRKILSLRATPLETPRAVPRKLWT